MVRAHLQDVRRIMFYTIKKGLRFISILLVHDIIQFGVNKDTLGDKKDKKCRFCKRTTLEVTFKKIAHAFPQSMGNRQLCTNYECDECNDYFSMNVEDCFGKYFMPLNNVMLIIKEKKGTPTIKSTSGIVRQESNPDSRQITIHVDIKPDNIAHKEKKFSIPEAGIEFDTEKNVVSFAYDKQPYIPMSVYKCFVKMAISIMPTDKVENFRETIDWIMNQKHDAFYPNGRKMILTRAWMRSAIPNGDIYYWLYEISDSDDLPSRTFFYVAWGQIWCMVEVPIKTRTDDFEVNNTPILTLLSEKTDKNNIAFFDLSNNTKIYGDKEHMYSTIIGELKRNAPK